MGTSNFNMLRNFTRRSWLVVLLGVLSALAVVLVGRWLNATKRGGQEPAEPFRIAGNLYYVGANDIAAFLITGPEGHVVLDGGYPTTAPMIMASIAKLGFDIKDVKVLLNSEPHPDHAGGLGVLQQASGAELWASEASADAIASGGDDPDIVLPLRALIRIGILGYPATRVDHRFKDGDTIRVGPIALTAHVTGGHTRGCTSWSFPVRDGDRVLNVVSACSLVVLQGMRYPEQGADLERSFRVLRSLPADIWVTSMRDSGAGTASSSHAPPRRTRWTRSSTPRAIAPTSTPPRRNSAKGLCTSRDTAPRCGGSCARVCAASSRCGSRILVPKEQLGHLQFSTVESSAAIEAATDPHISLSIGGRAQDLSGALEYEPLVVGRQLRVPAVLHDPVGLPPQRRHGPDTPAAHRIDDAVSLRRPPRPHRREITKRDLNRGPAVTIREPFVRLDPAGNSPLRHHPQSRFGPRSFRYATMSSTSLSVSTMKPPRDAEPTGSSASVKLKNR